MVKKSTTKSKKTKKKGATGRGKQGAAANKVMEKFASNPSLGITQLADDLEMRHQKVSQLLHTPAGMMMKEELDKLTLESLSRIRIKALTYFEDFLDNPLIRPDVKLNALKFALQTLMAREDEANPDELVFDTIISETGMVEQVTRKVYHKTTIKKGAEDEP